MSDLNDHIKRINEKLQRLLKDYQHLQKDNQRQSKQIGELQELRRQDAVQLTTIQEQLSIVKSASGQLSETDKKEFEKNIGRYIREIDKCIGLLSE